MPSQENNINIIEEKKNTLELIEKEIKQVDEMINITEKILEKMDKHAYYLMILQVMIKAITILELSQMMKSVQILESQMKMTQKIRI